MPDSDLVQQQREILRSFWQAVPDRPRQLAAAEAAHKAEVMAVEEQRKKALAAIEAQRNAEEAQAATSHDLEVQQAQAALENARRQAQSNRDLCQQQVTASLKRGNARPNLPASKATGIAIAAQVTELSECRQAVETQLQRDSQQAEQEYTKSIQEADNQQKMAKTTIQAQYERVQGSVRNASQLLASARLEHLMQGQLPAASNIPRGSVVTPQVMNQLEAHAKAADAELTALKALVQQYVPFQQAEARRSLRFYSLTCLAVLAVVSVLSGLLLHFRPLHVITESIEVIIRPSTLRPSHKSETQATSGMLFSMSFCSWRVGIASLVLSSHCAAGRQVFLCPLS